MCVLGRERGGGKKEKGSSNFPQLNPHHVVLIKFLFPSPERQELVDGGWQWRIQNPHGPVLGISAELAVGMVPSKEKFLSPPSLEYLQEAHALDGRMGQSVPEIPQVSGLKEHNQNPEMHIRFPFKKELERKWEILLEFFVHSPVSLHLFASTITIETWEWMGTDLMASVFIFPA